VSPLWADCVTALIAPERVALTRAYARWRRLPPRAADTPVTDAPAAGARRWGPAVAELARLAGRPEWQRAQVRVVLSNQFVRYALVPPAADVKRPAEVTALVRHQLRAAYGEAAGAWQLAVHPQGAGAPLLAAAIDPQLVVDLRAALGAGRLVVRAITPLFAYACNTHRGLFRGLDGFWFALAEPTRLCAAYWRGGCCVALRSQPSDGDWAAELPALLARMQLGEAPDSKPGRLFVACAGGLRDLELPAAWRPQALALAAFDAPPAAAPTRLKAAA